MTPHDNLGLATSIVADFSSHFSGEVLSKGAAGYDEARTLWNAMIDRYPAVIVRPKNASDVAAAVRFARSEGLRIAIKGGGHNVAGNAACDDGLMIDFADMRSVKVDRKRRTATVEPGALISDMDRETQAHGLATPGGFISSTGVAGLTLGGGFGYLSRKHGLTIDNLRQVDVVTVRGESVRASSDENPDLFWGLRGGGGNFGVATAFIFDLHEVGPEVLAGPIVHAWEGAADALTEAARVMQKMPDDVSCLMVLRHAPPAPFIPAALHGKPILLMAPVHFGHPAESEEALRPLRQVGRPIADAVVRRPYAEFQAMFDKAARHGARNYWKGHYFAEFPHAAAEILCRQVPHMLSKEGSIGFMSLGGAVARRPADSSPYPHRGAAWVLNIQARWRAAEDDRSNIAWARDTFEAVKPHTTGGVYVNLISSDEGDGRVHEAYGKRTYQRLAELKAKWDPENVLRLNQNILPAK